MGIQYRDYMRDGPSGGYSGGSGGRDMVKTIIIANVIVFVLQVVLTRMPSEAEVDRLVQNHLDQIDFQEQLEAYDVSPDSPEAQRLERYRRAQEAELKRYFSSEPIHIVSEWFNLDPRKVLHGQIWRLTTYDFLHNPYEIWHLLFNMLILYFAGRKVEAYYGSREFLAFYLAAGIISGICFVLWGLYFSDLTPAIGASGAVAAVMIAYAALWPNDEWYIWGLIRVRAVWIAIFTAAFDLHPMLLQLGRHNQFDDGVAHSAHVGGMLFGLLYVKRDWRVIDWLSPLQNLQRRLHRSRFKVVHPETVEGQNVRTVEPAHSRRQEVEARVDELLAKIASQGEASLSEEERRFLADASRHYRSRD